MRLSTSLPARILRGVGAGLFLLLATTGLRAQALRPGFDKAEYLELLRLHARMGGLDSMWWAGIPRPQQFKMVYRSPVVGLDNRWDLWAKAAGAQPQIVISIRGTTKAQESWFENLYAAMLRHRRAEAVAHPHVCLPASYQSAGGRARGLAPRHGVSGRGYRAQN